jgi:hypothetical protein
MSLPFERFKIACFVANPHRSYKPTFPFLWYSSSLLFATLFALAIHQSLVFLGEQLSVVHRSRKTSTL